MNLAIALQLNSCTKCQQAKPRAAFSPHPQTRSGLQSHCKACKNEARRRKYHDDPLGEKREAHRLRAELRRERDWYRKHYPRPDKPWNRKGI